VATLSVPDAAALLRNQAGRQVLLKLASAAGGDAFARVITPLAASEAANLRYDDWEHSRRLKVDEKSSGQIGYAHIRAMGTPNYYEFVRNYYAAANKGGLILDLRHNRGGNIDSWLLSRLMRPAWMWWAPRDGNVLLGVRPEHLTLDDAAPWRGEVSLVEPTGADTFVVVKTGVGDMTVRVSAQSRVRAGDAVGLHVAADHVNWFDAASGVRV